MNPRYIAAIVFIFIMIIFLYLKRKRIGTQKVLSTDVCFLMYRTKLGLKFMENFAKRFSKMLKHIGYFAIFVGFFGMIIITYFLIKNVINLLTKPDAIPGAALVLPFEVKGAFYVPFDYWIISIFIIALVHEFSHGILAKKYNMKIKSSGFAFVNLSLKAIGILIIIFSIFNKAKKVGYINLFNTFNFFSFASPDLWLIIGILLLFIPFIKNLLVPIIPAAFVEPDEKELRKKPPKEQLSVFAAGPFANIVLALIIYVVTISLIAPAIATTVFEQDGVLVTGVMEEYPAKEVGITENEVIKSIDNIKINELINFSNILKTKKPGDIIILETNRSVYNITLAENPENKSKAYLGVFVHQNTKVRESFIKKHDKTTLSIIMWFIELLFWLYVLNLGIGLFNLAPMGPLDGGRMLLVALQQFFKQEKAVKYWKNIGVFFLALVLINILFAFIR